MSPAETVAYLAEFYTAEQIRAFWKQAGDALMARVSKAVTITSSSFEGGSVTGIVLNNAEEMQAFMAACRAALAQLDEDDDGTVDPNTLGRVTDFSRAPVAV